MTTKRIIDMLASIAALLVFSLPMIVIAIAVRITSRGPALYWSKRVGRNNELFLMPKFRTMRTNTPVVATHLLHDPSRHLTPIGGFLRKTSLDELPQLWCVLIGEMSLVGPRPALFNQDDLIALRTAKGVHLLFPGLTGWAQINGRDEIELSRKVEYDAEYKERRGIAFDIYILLATITKVFRARGVSH